MRIRGIQLKLWRVTLANGTEQCVWATSRLMALLNYRHVYGYGVGVIAKAGLVRNADSTPVFKRL